MVLITVLALALGIASAQDKTITTGFTNNVVVQGNYWDITTFDNVNIKKIGVLTNGCFGEYQIQLYKRETFGTYQGFENDPSAWELVFDETVVCSFTQPSAEVTLPSSLFIPAGQTQALFMYFVLNDITDTTVALIVTNELDVIVANQDMAIFSGTAVEAGGNIFSRVSDDFGYEPNIVLTYDIGTPFPTMAPSSPTLSPVITTSTPTSDNSNGNGKGKGFRPLRKGERIDIYDYRKYGHYGYGKGGRGDDVTPAPSIATTRGELGPQDAVVTETKSPTENDGNSNSHYKEKAISKFERISTLIKNFNPYGFQNYGVPH